MALSGRGEGLGRASKAVAGGGASAPNVGTPNIDQGVAEAPKAGVELGAPNAVMAADAATPNNGAEPQIVQNEDASAGTVEDSTPNGVADAASAPKMGAVGGGGLAQSREFALLLLPPPKWNTGTVDLGNTMCAGAGVGVSSVTVIPRGSAVDVSTGMELEPIILGELPKGGAGAIVGATEEEDGENALPGLDKVKEAAAGLQLEERAPKAGSALTTEYTSSISGRWSAL